MNDNDGRTDDAPLAIARGFRLQWEEAQQCDVLLYPEGMVKLNPSSAEILKLCDGSRSLAAVIDTLQRKYPDADLADDVREFVAAARQNGWLAG